MHYSPSIGAINTRGSYWVPLDYHLVVQPQLTFWRMAGKFAGQRFTLRIMCIMSYGMLGTLFFQSPDVRFLSLNFPFFYYILLILICSLIYHKLHEKLCPVALPGSTNH